MSNEKPDRWNLWEIDMEMVEAIEMHRDFLKTIILPGDVVLYESKLDLRHIHPEMFGTGDVLIYRPSTRHLWVIDFKYGSGIAVEVHNNTQALSYGLGGLKLFDGKVDNITIAIVQPRAFHRDGQIRTQDLTLVELKAFEEWLRDIAARLKDPGNKAVVSEHCRFCPAAFACDELRDFVAKACGARWKQKPTEKALPDPKTMTSKQIGRVYMEAQIIESWFRRVMEHAHAEAMDGRVPEGLKIVNKRVYRRWGDIDGVLAVLDLYDIDESDYMTEPEAPALKSPAQLEKSLGKKMFEVVAKTLVVKPTPGFVLARQDDARPEARVQKSDGFGAVDEED